MGRSHPALPDRPGLSKLFEVRRQFAEGYGVMKELLPERVEQDPIHVIAWIDNSCLVGGGA